MSTSKEIYTVSREDAANVLGVSTRTIDRYLKTRRLKFRAAGRNVFVNAEELSKLAAKLAGKPKAQPNKEHYRSQPTQQPRSDSSMTIENNNSIEEKIFRELYTDATNELRAKQEKLEAASFRVGQLEAQLKNSVPLLEYKQKEEALTKENSWLKQKMFSLKIQTWILLAGFLLATTVAIVLGVVGF